MKDVNIQSIIDWHIKTYPAEELSDLTPRFALTMKKFQQTKGNNAKLKLVAELMIIAACMGRFSVLTSAKAFEFANSCACDVGTKQPPLNREIFLKMLENQKKEPQTMIKKTKNRIIAWIKSLF